MRRQDLVLTLEESLAIIDNNEYIVLCLNDPSGLPYGVPMDYVHQGNSLFFCGAKEGRKVSSMKANPRACAVIIAIEKEIIPNIPNVSGRTYTSVIVEGRIELIDETEIKRQVMTWMVKRRNPEYVEKGQAVIEKMMDRILVYKLSMETVSGKKGL